MYTKLEAKVEYEIMYIDVAEETLGGTPMLKNIGLNIAPPPKPRAPEIHPPIKALKNNFKTTFFSYLRSLSTSPYPSFFFRACSFLFIQIAIPVMKKHKAKNIP